MPAPCFLAAIFLIRYCRIIRCIPVWSWSFMRARFSGFCCAAFFCITLLSQYRTGPLQKTLVLLRLCPSEPFFWMLLNWCWKSASAWWYSLFCRQSSEVFLLFLHPSALFSLFFLRSPVVLPLSVFFRFSFAWKRAWSWVAQPSADYASLSSLLHFFAHKSCPAFNIWQTKALSAWSPQRLYGFCIRLSDDTD